MTDRRPVRITRRASLPPLECIRAGTLDGLLAALSLEGIANPVVADLSLGAWRSHELARSCFAQLEVAWPLPSPTPPEWRGFTSTWMAPISADGSVQRDAAAAVIGDWIDSEGRGDSAALSALMLAEGLLAALDDEPLSLVVLAPRFGLPWQTESALFLRYLAYGKRPADRLILLGDEHLGKDECAGFELRWSDAPARPPRPRPTGLVPLVPSCLDPKTQQALGAEGHALRAGWRLVPPEWRIAPSATPRLVYDRLAAAPVDSWLLSFAHVHGNNYFVDPWFLCAEANQRLAEGGHDIALRLMERAAVCAQRAADRAAIQALAQGFRIALMRYGEVIAAPDPSPALSPSLRGALMMTKGWGLVMSGHARRAEPYMESARELLGPIFGRNRQFLYLLNISALNRVNLGDLDGAMALEKEIEAASAALEDSDYHLAYVNWINIARLHRRRHEFDIAETYYERAFATTAGARTESDLVYINVCMARLHAARGNIRAAFLAWLRAALHWLSCDAPEALGWRVLSTVLGRKATPADTPVPEMAMALSKHLRAAAASAGVTSLPEISRCAPTFMRADRALISGGAAALTSAEAIGADGFGVIVTAAPGCPAFDDPCHETLAALVRDLLALEARCSTLVEYPTILVDDRHGQELPTVHEELIATCLRRSVNRARFNGEVIELPASRRAALLDCTEVRRGPAVARVEPLCDGCRIYFKRYRSPCLLSADEGAVLAAADAGVTLPDLWPQLKRERDEVIGLVRQLEAKRVVEIRVDLR